MINKVSSVVLPFDMLMIARVRLNRNDAYEELAIIDDNVVNRLLAHGSKKQR